MVIDNKLLAAKVSLSFQIVMALTVVSFAFIFAFRNPMEIAIAKILFTLIALTYIGLLLVNYHYFQFFDSSARLIFRFYNLHPFFKKPKAIEIPKQHFAGFEIVEKLGGLRKQLHLYVHTKTGKVPYPPLSVSGLSRQQLKQLKQSLNRWKVTAKKH